MFTTKKITTPFGQILFGTDVLKNLSEDFNNFENELREYAKELKQNFEIFIHDSVQKTDSGYEIELMIPGYTKNDITISADERELIVSADIKEENSKKKSFTKKYKMSEKNDVEKITSKMADGVLTISIPDKEQKELNKKTIKID